MKLQHFIVLSGELYAVFFSIKVSSKAGQHEKVEQ